jgi:hypothetical protein
MMTGKVGLVNNVSSSIIFGAARLFEFTASQRIMTFGLTQLSSVGD